MTSPLQRNVLEGRVGAGLPAQILALLLTNCGTQGKPLELGFPLCSKDSEVPAFQGC